MCGHVHAIRELVNLSCCFHACQGEVAASTAGVNCIIHSAPAQARYLGVQLPQHSTPPSTTPGFDSTPLPRLQLLLAPDQALDVATDMMSLSLSVIGKPQASAQASNNAVMM